MPKYIEVDKLLEVMAECDEIVRKVKGALWT